jgi:hypothetical protein
MILRATQKVRDRIGLKSPDSEPTNRAQRFLEEWYINSIVLDRRQYFLLSEATTVYSVVVPSKGITSRKKLEELAVDVLFDQFKHHPGLNNRIFESLAESVVILRTQNRSILSSMNQLTLAAEYGDDDPSQGFDYLNGIILGALKYDSPRDAFAKAVDSIDQSQY